MFPVPDAALAASGVAVVGVLSAAATYLVARRQSSGQIATSDAATLWLESQAMRKELREEVIGLRSELASARTELATTRTELTATRTELFKARREIGALQQRLARSEREAERRIGKLEEEVEGHEDPPDSRRLTSSDP